MPPPFLLVFAEPNGSGKSTLVLEIADRGMDLGEQINPDIIAATLTGEYGARVREAQSIADARRDACLAEKRSFSFETVMSHPSKLEIMRAARDAGFSVTLYFVGVEDPSINIDRVALRVAQGGHDVPPDRVVARYGRTMKLLASAIGIAHRAVIFDNSSIGDDPDLWLRPVAATSGDGEAFEIEYVVSPDARDFPDWVKKYLPSPR